MTAEAQSFGFNQQPPIDLPHSPFEVVALPPARLLRRAPRSSWPISSIGQDCTIATPLQMALVAAGIANGGVVMTPHVMYQIRDSQNNLVEHVPAHGLAPGHVPGHGQRRDQLMSKVVTVRDRRRRRLPAAEDVAAKTGTAQVGLGNTLTTDWMIAFAPASNPTVAIAVAMPHQPVDRPAPRSPARS